MSNGKCQRGSSFGRCDYCHLGREDVCQLIVESTRRMDEDVNRLLSQRKTTACEPGQAFTIEPGQAFTLTSRLDQLAMASASRFARSMDKIEFERDAAERLARQQARDYSDLMRMAAEPEYYARAAESAATLRERGRIAARRVAGEREDREQAAMASHLNYLWAELPKDTHLHWHDPHLGEQSTGTGDRGTSDLVAPSAGINWNIDMVKGKGEADIAVAGDPTTMTVHWSEAMKGSDAMTSSANPSDDRYPHSCPQCGSKAYVGLTEVDCSKGCR